jgi:hypothetical protein
MLAMFGGGAFMATGVALLGTHQGLVAHLPAPGMGWLWLAWLLSVCFLTRQPGPAIRRKARGLAAGTTALVGAACCR